MVKIVLGAAMFFSSVFVYGQILKINKGHLFSDSSNYLTGVVDAAFAVNNRSSTASEQNVYLGIRNQMDVVYIGDQSATIVIGGINYFKIGDGPVISNGSGHVREIFRRKASFSPELFAQIQYDESRNMKTRQLAGGGFRFSPIRGENTLFMGIGAFREYELWQGMDNSIIMQLWKMNSYAGGEVNLSKDIFINAIVYFQSGIDPSIDSFRSRISGHLELKDKVSKHVIVKIISDFLMDDRPIIPLNRIIYEMYFGVEYRLN